jgi:hypothetical protein
MQLSGARLRRRRAIWVLLAAAVIGSTSLASFGAVLAAASSPEASVTAVMHLDHTTVRPGPPAWGAVVVTNHSGQVLHIHGCANRRGLVAGLVSSRVTYDPGLPLRGCHQLRDVGPGTTTFKTWVATTYQYCGVRGQPACHPGFGLSDLPPGRYRVRFPLAGLPLTSKVELPESVTVLPPAWLVSLHGSQGSLLVAASPCMGTADSGNLPVTVVVIHHGRSLARRSARGGADFTFALPPGRYVVRTSAHLRAVVHVQTRRQTLTNLTACGY